MPAVARAIVGFSVDAEGHWVAQLACGHAQHVRHNPPWELRPWVLTERGRHEHLGEALSCANCGMPALPSDVVPREPAASFDETTIPQHLLRTHLLEGGCWARIVVERGRLLYVVESVPEETFVLRPEVPGVVAPGIPHRIEVRGQVRFRWEPFIIEDAAR